MLCALADPALVAVIVCPYNGVLFLFVFFFNDTATTEIYTLSLHDALPISAFRRCRRRAPVQARPSWRSPRSEEHTSELQSRGLISYAVFCLKKKTKVNRGDLHRSVTCSVEASTRSPPPRT